jgi:surface polysaccharide O-acyltransferase-like enzyme
MKSAETQAAPKLPPPTADKPRPGLVWADRLRNLATVMVITLHVSAPVAQEYPLYDTWWWWSGNLWDSFSRPAVPLFVMLSGFLLLGKDYDLGDFLKRRFARVVVPALFWMAVYSFYNYKAHQDPATLTAAIRGIIKGPVHYHLWFIYLIVGLYVSYPVLRPWIRGARERDYFYFFAVCAVGTWLYKILGGFFDLKIGVYFEFFTNQAGYFVLGHYLGCKAVGGSRAPGGERQAEQPIDNQYLITPWSFSSKRMLQISVVLILLGTGVTALGTWWASVQFGGKFHPFFYDYLTPNVTIATAGWFIFAQYAFKRGGLLEFEQTLAQASFGIYFAHVLVMDWFSESGYWQSKYHPALCIPVVSGLVFCMVFIAVSIIRALPGGKRIT